MNWWIKIKLLFCKKIYSIDHSRDSDDYAVCVVTKILDGKIYVIDEYIVGVPTQ